MTESLRILAFGAHPDDLETYVGAALLCMARLGCSMTFVLATDGEAGTLQPSEGTRVDEQLASLEWFQRQTGTLPAFHRLCFVDASLSTCTDLRDACKAMIRMHEPHLVIAPSEDDAHQDHRALACALSADVGVHVRWLDAEAASATHALVMDEATHCEKRTWMRHHLSQFPAPDGSRAHLPSGRDIEERILERDAACGTRLGHDFAEPIEVCARLPNALADLWSTL
ncbi:MAG: PIG-L family deacetylase [Planctomycetes bacterium]|nr:PIG-L family deacetylase [Planctomycetota bacterium]MCB9916799.1 PIG-L family deacetylase [Planctomycetota bacterium]